MKKYITLLTTLTFALIFTMACGTTDEKADKQVGGSKETGYEETNNDGVVNDEMVATDIQLQGGKYVFTLKNISTKEIELTFPSSQVYEYMIKDSQGNHVYTYSMDKMFAMVMSMKQLAPGDQLSYEVDVDVLSILEAGTYTLEIWSIALEIEGVTSEIEITIE